MDQEKLADKLTRRVLSHYHADSETPCWIAARLRRPERSRFIVTTDSSERPLLDTACAPNFLDDEEISMSEAYRLTKEWIRQRLPQLLARIAEALGEEEEDAHHGVRSEKRRHRLLDSWAGYRARKSQ